MRRAVFVVAPLLSLTVLAAPCCLYDSSGATIAHCSAEVPDPHPANYTEAEIIVRTKPGAEVTGTEHRGSAHAAQRGVANSRGVAYIYFKISYVLEREVTNVTIVSKKGSLTETCRTSFEAT
jgi:hypothetical protein